ncbi:MAG: hypothetical protein M1835_001990, partial [Candelina submexicana]
ALKAMLETRGCSHLQWIGDPLVCSLCHDSSPDTFVASTRFPTKPLIELAGGHSTVTEVFEPLLALLLKRGKNLNSVCASHGAMIHALIKRGDTYQDYRAERLAIILHHGANVNLIGPYGTPLQQAWNQRAKEGEDDVDLSGIFEILISHGATFGWQAADGTVPTKWDILLWRPSVFN